MVSQWSLCCGGEVHFGEVNENEPDYENNPIIINTEDGFHGLDQMENPFRPEDDIVIVPVL
jgi:hypothetical protein